MFTQHNGLTTVNEIIINIILFMNTVTHLRITTQCSGTKETTTNTQNGNVPLIDEKVGLDLLYIVEGYILWRYISSVSGSKIFFMRASTIESIITNIRKTHLGNLT